MISDHTRSVGARQFGVRPAQHEETHGSKSVEEERDEHDVGGELFEIEEEQDRDAGGGLRGERIMRRAAPAGFPTRARATGPPAGAPDGGTGDPRPGNPPFPGRAESRSSRSRSNDRNPKASITRQAWWWNPRHERPS